MPDWKWLRKLAGCPDPEPPVPPTHELYYAYYGTGDGQVAQTHTHVNLVHIGAWGDWVTPQGRINLTNVILSYAMEAKGANLPVMLTMDWCLFTQTNPRKRLDGEVSRGYMDAFFTRLRDEGLLESVVAFYPIDEPNIPEIDLSDADMTHSNEWLRAVAGFYWDPLPELAVIYGGDGDRLDNTPGIASFNWCGFDSYGTTSFPNSKYSQLVSKMTAEQRTILVPGGASPWREDPMPFYNYAVTDPRVLMIMPFLWLGADGIGVNGMAPQYQAVGNLILNQ